MRLAFMGTPEFSVPFLRALHAAGHEIAAVYTRPPRPNGRRGLSAAPSPVHLAAKSLGLPVFTPKTLRDAESQAQFQGLAPQAAVIVAYGLLLPEPVLNAPLLGCYNAHASLLPRWRGAAPVQRAIEAGDKETGIVIMRMDKGLDTGPLLCAGGGSAADSAFLRRVPIVEDMTAGEAFAALAEAGAELMAKAVRALAQGAFHLAPQSAQGITYAHKIEKQEARIEWRKPAFAVHKHICAFSPSPGAWCEMEFGGAGAGQGRRERVKILGAHIPAAAELSAAEQQGMILLQAALADAGAASTASAAAAQAVPRARAKAAVLAVQCAQGIIFLTKLQKAGGTALTAQEFLRGAAPSAVL